MTDESPDEAHVLNAYRWVRGHASWLGLGAMTAGAILLSFGTDHAPAFWPGVGCTAVGFILQVWLEPQYTKLIKSEAASRERANHRSVALQRIMHAGLRTLMDELNTDFSRARVSVYRHKDGRFIRLARVSENQALEEPGRSSYPSKGGLIGRSWELGKGVVTNLPADRPDWETFCVEKYEMDRDAVEHLSMQSRSLVGLRIDGHGPDPEHVGLIVLESLAPSGVNGRTLDDIGNLDAYKLLTHVLIEAGNCLDEADTETFMKAKT